MLAFLHSTQRTSARDRGTDIGMGVDAENTRRVGSTVTIAAAKMVVIVVSRLSLTLRKERKRKREKGKEKIELRVSGRDTETRENLGARRMRAFTPAAFPPLSFGASPHVKTCGSAWGIKSINPRPQIHSNLPSMPPRGSLEACK